ncbi:hypothetical protein LIER_11130 [Lithospermum erythrorhizon]|uniref:Uncharacterized protein n=1 Tax=Lithospermum erythrorhizon TaxID=34254 RepID=A0AAV3PPS0_LITER
MVMDWAWDVVYVFIRIWSEPRIRYTLANVDLSFPRYAQANVALKLPGYGQVSVYLSLPGYGHVGVDLDMIRVGMPA